MGAEFLEVTGGVHQLLVKTMQLDLKLSPGVLVHVLGQPEEFYHGLGLLRCVDFHDLLEAGLSKVIVTLFLHVEPSSDSLLCL